MFYIKRSVVLVFIAFYIELSVFKGKLKLLVTVIKYLDLWTFANLYSTHVNLEIQWDLYNVCKQIQVTLELCELNNWYFSVIKFKKSSKPQ